MEYSTIAPFERFAKLKRLIEVRKRWWHHSGKTAYFERQWKPSKWTQRARLVFVCQKCKVQYKDPVQLELSVPFVWGYDFKVIVINQRIRACWPSIISRVRMNGPLRTESRLPD